MRHGVARWSLVALLALLPISTSADSNPFIEGTATGIEFCAQADCGAALFLAVFQGTIGSRPADGLVFAAINHEELPSVGSTSLVLDGTWSITTPGRTLRGTVPGGVIQNLDNVRYLVCLNMQIQRGGNGDFWAAVLLDHEPFLEQGLPPTIDAVISQDVPDGCQALIGD